MNGIEIQTQGDAKVVTPVGNFDLTNSDDLRTAILGALSADGSAVVVDLSRTHYLDSAGIRVLFAVARRLYERRRHLVLVVPTESQLRRLLSIVDIESRVALYPTLADALAMLGSESSR